MVSFGIMATGNELTLGKTQDTNSHFLAKELASLGHQVSFFVVCADIKEDFLKTLSFLLEHVDEVFITGGMGPTSDDLTAELVAFFLKEPLVFSDEGWDYCQQRFLKMGLSLENIPAVNKKQAYFPSSASLLPNHEGTACGFQVPVSYKGKEKRIFAFPGVPREMMAMFFSSVKPLFESQSHHKFSKDWTVYGLGESAMQTKLNDVEAYLKKNWPECLISYRAHEGYVNYNLSFSSEDQKKFSGFQKEIEDVTFLVEKQLGDFSVVRDEIDLLSFIIRKLKEKKQTLSFVETSLGGLLSSEFVAYPEGGVSSFYKGSLIPYSNESKDTFLKLDPNFILTTGAVSAQSAAKLALRGAHSFNTSLTLSETGVAGPGGGSEINPVGQFYLGLVVREQVLSPKVEERLMRFGYEVVSEEKTVCYVLKKQFRGERRRIQTFVKNTMLCTLAIVLS